MRRWLGDKKPTLHDLADEYGVSAERIRQIEKRAMDKMKGMITMAHQRRRQEQQEVAKQVARILHDASDRALSILNEGREKLDALARALVEREEVSEKEIVELIGPSVHHSDDNGKSFTNSGELAAQDSVGL